MSQSPLLSETEIVDALQSLPGWAHVDHALEKRWKFRDFSEALGFIVRVGLEAERLNHHPDLANAYNRVTLILNTHAMGGRVTALDVELARAIEKLA